MYTYFYRPGVPDGGVIFPMMTKQMNGIDNLIQLPLNDNLLAKSRHPFCLCSRIKVKMLFPETSLQMRRDVSRREGEDPNQTVPSFLLKDKK